MIPDTSNLMTPYNLHVGDWVYVKDKYYQPVKIASMDDCKIATSFGDIYSFAVLKPVFISDKTIKEFSLPCKGMAIKGKEGKYWWFSVMDKDGEVWEFKTNSIHNLQLHYYGITKRYLNLQWRKGDV